MIESILHFLARSLELLEGLSCLILKAALSRLSAAHFFVRFHLINWVSEGLFAQHFKRENDLLFGSD